MLARVVRHIPFLRLFNKQLALKPIELLFQRLDSFILLLGGIAQLLVQGLQALNVIRGFGVEPDLDLGFREKIRSCAPAVLHPGPVPAPPAS